MKLYKFDIRNLTDAEYSKWFSLMCEAKQRRIQKFRNIDDKKRSVVGEMLARTAVCEWCNIEAKDIIFLEKEHGKPYAKDLEVEFNISHSDNMVVCAVSDKPIGIDIEKIRPIDLAIAKRICNNVELEYLFGFAPTQQDFKKTDDIQILLRFFELWTAKEAYGKCLGNGLASISASAKENVEKIVIENEYFISIYM